MWITCFSSNVNLNLIAQYVHNITHWNWTTYFNSSRNPWDIFKYDIKLWNLRPAEVGVSIWFQLRTMTTLMRWKSTVSETFRCTQSQSHSPWLCLEYPRRATYPRANTMEMSAHVRSTRECVWDQVKFDIFQMVLPWFSDFTHLDWE